MSRESSKTFGLLNSKVEMMRPITVSDRFVVMGNCKRNHGPTLGFIDICEPLNENLSIFKS